MLDVYRIPNTMPLEVCNRDDYLGSLSMIEHKSLRCVFQDPRSIPISFFDDTYLTPAQVQAMLKICHTCQASLVAKGNLGNTIYKKLMGMLEDAAARGYGMIFVCD
jgi:hypothetical protein